MRLDQQSAQWTDDAPSREQGGITSLDRALDIVEAFSPAKSEYGLTELSKHLGIPKATTHRLLIALVRRGYVTVVDHRYRLGTRVLAVAHAAVSARELRAVAQPQLHRLRERTGETVHLAVRDGAEVVYTDKVDSWHSVRPHTWIGFRACVHSTSLGKALLSLEHDELVRGLLAGKTLVKKTPHTMVNLDDVLADIRRTRERGYALDLEEDTPGMRCVAAPIRDHTGSVCAAVGIAGPVNRLRRERIERVAPAVVDAARQISLELGAPS